MLHVIFAAGLSLAIGAGCVGEREDETTELVDSAESAVAGSTTFQNGVSPSAAYAGTTDTTLQQNAPTTAAGEGVSISADYVTSGAGFSAEGLLRFDVGAIPSGSTVSAATLTLNITNATSGTPYVFYPLARAWTEAQATWNSAASGVAWASGGARGASDRGSAGVASLTPTAVGKTTITLNAAGVAAVQAWVDDPSSNRSSATRP